MNATQMSIIRSYLDTLHGAPYFEMAVGDMNKSILKAAGISEIVIRPNEARNLGDEYFGAQPHGQSVKKDSGKRRGRQANVKQLTWKDKGLDTGHHILHCASGGEIEITNGSTDRGKWKVVGWPTKAELLARGVPEEMLKDFNPLTDDNMKQELKKAQSGGRFETTFRNMTKTGQFKATVNFNPKNWISLNSFKRLDVHIADHLASKPPATLAEEPKAEEAKEQVVEEAKTEIEMLASTTPTPNLDELIDHQDDVLKAAVA